MMVVRPSVRLTVRLVRSISRNTPPPQPPPPYLVRARIHTYVYTRTRAIFIFEIAYARAKGLVRDTRTRTHKRTAGGFDHYPGRVARIHVDVFSGSVEISDTGKRKRGTDETTFGDGKMVGDGKKAFSIESNEIIQIIIEIVRLSTLIPFLLRSAGKRRDAQ